MFESQGGERHDPPVGHQHVEAAALGDLADVGQRCLERRIGDQTCCDIGCDGCQELEIFPIGNGVGQSRASVACAFCELVEGNVGGGLSGSHAAGLEQVMQVGGQAIADVDHGMQSAGFE